MIGAPTRLHSAPHCPFCGAESDGFTVVTDADAQPRPGDIAVCLCCCEINVYDCEPITLRRPTGVEAVEFAADPDLTQARETARWARSKGGFQERSRLQ